MAIKAVIFDLNGVFIVSRSLSERFEEKYGVPEVKFIPALKDVMAKARMPGARPIFSYWAPYFAGWKVSLTADQFFDFWFRGESMAETEMINIARKLKGEGMKLFILSNNFRERSAHYDIAFPFLKELFNECYYSWQTGFVKPDTCAFQKIFTDHHLKPDECLYFDDRKENIIAAKSLGIYAYFFNGADDVREKLGEHGFRVDVIA